MDENYGIGNRIFAIVNAARFYAPDCINVYWAKEGWVTETMGSLFCFNGNLNVVEYNSKEEMNLRNSKTERTVEFPQASLIDENGKERTLSKGNVTDETYALYKNIFKNIMPSDMVLNRIKDVVLPDYFVALQIRNSRDWDDYGRNESLDLFIEKINTYPKDAVFYISTMEQSVSDYIKNNTGYRFLELPNKDYHSMCDALADLFIMAKANEGIYSYGSTFGEMAWWFADKQQKYTMVGTDRNWK